MKSWILCLIGWETWTGRHFLKFSRLWHYLNQAFKFMKLSNCSFELGSWGEKCVKFHKYSRYTYEISKHSALRPKVLFKYRLLKCKALLPICLFTCSKVKPMRNSYFLIPLVSIFDLHDGSKPSFFRLLIFFVPIYLSHFISNKRMIDETGHENHQIEKKLIFWKSTFFVRK